MNAIRNAVAVIKSERERVEKGGRIKWKQIQGRMNNTNDFDHKYLMDIINVLYIPLHFSFIFNQDAVFTRIIYFFEKEFIKKNSLIKLCWEKI
jgi:hypothetical protein